MTAALLRRWDAYAAFTRIGFLIPLAFRLFPFMMIISYPIIMTGNYYLYRAIYSAKGGAPIAGMTLEQAITYLLICWTVRSFYKNPLARIIGERVKSGDIAIDLIRPIDVFANYLCQGIGRGLHRLVFISIPLVLLIVCSQRVALPPDALTWFLFLVSAIGGFLLNCGFGYIVGLLAFFFEYNDGLDWVLDLLTKLLGGLMLPLTFFPDKIVGILKLLPFAGMYFQPASIFMGTIHGDAAWQAVALQYTWIFLLMGTGRLMLHFGSRKLLVQGG
ncbi:MAG: ABC-2 family transporter protein [bacterium]